MLRFCMQLIGMPLDSYLSGENGWTGLSLSMMVSDQCTWARAGVTWLPEPCLILWSEFDVEFLCLIIWTMWVRCLLLDGVMNCPHGFSCFDYRETLKWLGWARMLLLWFWWREILVISLESSVYNRLLVSWISLLIIERCCVHGLNCLACMQWAWCPDRALVRSLQPVNHWDVCDSHLAD